MNTTIIRAQRRRYVGGFMKKILCGLALALVANFSFASMSDFVSVPPFLEDGEDPLVMFVMSNDNQLWHKAYTDYSDLDNDGDLDTTYMDDFVYYGYFNSEFCYTYSGGMFVPAGKVLVPASSTNGTPNHSCTNATGGWSGNFLNWLTMTRMDVVRKVLYGGYRSTDTTSATVLQRALLPDDNHAFVKVVKNSDIGAISDFTPISGESVVSFCNVTDGTGDSGVLNVATYPPKLKVAAGSYLTWSGSERNLCMFEDEVEGDNGNRHKPFIPSRPTSISGLTQFEFDVRVKVCVDGEDQSYCRRYTDGNSEYYKPYGLLQTYGENGGLQFGLMTGSYTNNDKGGVLRKNIAYMGGSNAVEGDKEIDIATGVFINQGSTHNGIINTLNRFRIQGWDFSRNFYEDCEPWGITKAQFLNPANNDQLCRDWGNPIAELYLEALRYFAGEDPASSYTYADGTNDVLTGLNKVAWTDPFDNAVECSNCAIIALSTGVNTFDGDHLGSVISSSSLPNLASLETDLKAKYTNTVGTAEGIDGQSFMIGKATSEDTETCTAKTVANLSDAEGICPEVPNLEGTYQLAGLSYYGMLNDLRSESGTQNVKSYMVSLAESVPSLEVFTSNNESVRIVPYCHATRHSCTTNRWGRETCTVESENVCTLVDVVAQDISDTYGAFYISWEDSLVGSDNDMDAYMVLEYCTATGNQNQVDRACGSYTEDNEDDMPEWLEASTGDIQLRLSQVANSTNVEMDFGFVIAGSAGRDGTYTPLTMPRGYREFNSAALTGTGSDAEDATVWAGSVNKFTAAAGTPGVLENPLWYAAKYGNFDDGNGNNIPDIQSEWDKTDTRGNAGSDGIPDAYFPVRNPAYLEESLRRALSDITTRVSSGTAASVVASTGSGEGVLYQALYNPVYEIQQGEEKRSVDWVGTLHALFIDSYAQLREDVVPSGESAGMLSSADPIIDIYYDQSLQKTMVQRYTVGSDGKKGTAIGDPVEIAEISPIWSARDELAKLTNLTANRSYSDTADSGRYIFTAIDDPNARDGIVSQAEVVPFVASTFEPSASDHSFRLLDFGGDKDDVTNLVNYIRGDESISGFRSRSIEYDGNNANGDEPWLLGDIINSSPVALTRPNKGYDVSYNDDTYREYRNAMENRRQVVFVGANDGMLHAFNGGFYSSSVSGYKTALSGESAHPLGSELWAYVPYNLLPHLQYLTREDYAHVYYVDGLPQLFDVNDVWASDTKISHPSGWGSILVVGMRFGGGEVNVDPTGDDNGTIALRSGYIILDVTDPESPPELIAEVTHENLGYAMSVPTLVKMRARNSSTGSYNQPQTNEWFLVFGSGPAGSTSEGKSAALHDVTSEKTAKIYAYNLKTRALQEFNTTISNAFVGGVEAADWDNDFQDDAVYFGVVGGTEASPTGQLMRGELTLSGSSLSMTFSSVLDVTNQPFSAQPSVVKDRSNDFWVYAGTGRSFTTEDLLSSTAQTFYGVKDPSANTGTSVTVAKTAMVDTTGIDVYSDGAVQRSGATVTLNTSETVASFAEVKSAVADNAGWYFDFPRPRERNTTKAVLATESLLITSYQPSGDVCNISDGSGFLYAPHYQAGIPGEWGPLGTDPNNTLNGAEKVEPSINLGSGNPSSPVVHRNVEGKTFTITQMDTGVPDISELRLRPRNGHRQSWREIPIEW